MQYAFPIFEQLFLVPFSPRQDQMLLPSGHGSCQKGWRIHRKAGAMLAKACVKVRPLMRATFIIQGDNDSQESGNLRHGSKSPPAVEYPDWIAGLTHVRL